MSAAQTAVLEDIVDQHFDEAVDLWSQRDAATTASNYSLKDMVFLDGRLEAHIDGLRIAGEHGLKLAEAGLDTEEPGSVFVAAILAFENGVSEQIDMITALSEESHAAFRAVVSGLGWMKNHRFNATIKGLVSAKSVLHRRLGIAACGIRRINPKTYLDRSINSSDLALKARALRVAGEIGRLDLLSVLQEHLQHEDHDCRFAAARSALLLGDRPALDTLAGFVLSQSRFTLPAMHIALWLSDTMTARNWLKAQSQVPEQRRQMLIGTGITGEPGYVPMLIKRMNEPESARIAGHAFSMITGVNLEEQGLDTEKPEGFEAGPNDDPEDENVDMDMDENLPWPDADLVTRWWKQNGNAFSQGTRYLAGSPVSPESCLQILESANQDARLAASVELALSSAETAFINVKAPGYKQLR